MEDRVTLKDLKDRVKASIKEREIKMTIRSHWETNKKTYIGVGIGALGVGVISALTNRSAQPITITNNLTVVAPDPQKIHTL